jgi:hypothetical protein
MVTEREAIVNPRTHRDHNERPETIRTDSSSKPSVIRMTREEWRLQRLHELADIFEAAFEVKS